MTNRYKVRIILFWWSMHQPNRVNYKFHDFFKSGS